MIYWACWGRKHSQYHPTELWWMMLCWYWTRKKKTLRWEIVPKLTTGKMLGRVNPNRKCNYSKTSYNSDIQYIRVCNILTVNLKSFFFSLPLFHPYTAIFFLFLIDCERPNICLENNSIFCCLELFLKSGRYILVHSSLLLTLFLSSGKINGGLRPPPSHEKLASLPQVCQQLVVPFAPFMMQSLHPKNFS